MMRNASGRPSRGAFAAKAAANGAQTRRQSLVKVRQVSHAIGAEITEIDLSPGKSGTQVT
jgi:hypothetical protein